MEVTQAKISLMKGVKFHKSLFNWHSQFDLSLYAAEHFY